ncbi:hypothetical protein B0A54_09223 [Friedmanniomyces endolithicus]|uniref:Uncharacterized protein n=1 Tax=Friedmanniomyces endolithicus TaxID=329885 RepID=A0A4U0URA8_9PEZI|nr:hypothetical protein LTS09_001395 [Friedmanniomyces endolithicus]TKA38283.1 hypothetical protein B0A54_09223 [Friedmanniomyces endolithicus]
MPDLAPAGPLDGNKGLLSPVGDIVGQVLDKGLSPIGHVTGAIGNPNGEAILAVKEYVRKAMGGGDEDDEEEVGDAKDEAKPKSEKPGGESIGGKVKSGQNALGL